MINQQEIETFSTQILMAKIAILENGLADKNVLIANQASVIAESETSISGLKTELATQTLVISERETSIAEHAQSILKLTSQNEYLKFQLEQLRRMIFGSKRERFVSNIDINQLRIEFEPRAAEIEESVKAEREKIRVEYERKKPKKEHHGRMALPAHLPVVETIIEPTEDTTGMVCIGKDVTEELDYTPGTLHINRIIRPKYITPEDEKGQQTQVIAPLKRPIPKCMASAALLTMIFIHKFIYHLPLYRILKQIIQMGVPLPSSTLESWVKLAAGLLRPLYALHRLYVFRELYQMIDEPPIKVQDKDKPGACHQGYM